MTNLTTQQSDFIQFLIQNPTSSVTLEALAGTGKTFTLLQGLAKIPEPTLFLAFNKRIQVELSGKISAPHEAMTFNSLGHRTLAKMVRSRLSLNTDKMFQITKELELPWDLFQPTLALARKAKASGMIPPKAPMGLKATGEDAWQILCDLEEVSDSTIPNAKEVLRRSFAAALEGQIDFDDQIVMPIHYRGPFPKFQTVFVDEAQDLNHLQHEMLRRIVKTRLVAAGDPHQAIYGFRGASRNSMTELSDLFDSKRLPLTLTWRCPKEVVRVAQTVVHTYEAAPTNPTGQVETLTNLDPASIPEGAAVICRYNAPLFKLASRMIRQRLSVRIEGRDLGAGLIKTIKEIKGEDRTSFMSNLGTWYNSEMAKAHDREIKQAKIQDRYECILAIMDSCESKSEALDTCELLFRQKAKVVLSTIHKAKGLEWPTVYFLDHDFKWRDEQDENAWYVAVTRAQQALFLI
jgi:DNA helicase II / ATP-dependent DNA helicase PcrA